MDDKSRLSAILDGYTRTRSLYEDFARTLAALLGTFLNEAGIRVHSITWRAKAPDSLLRKLESAPGKYAELTDVTDLAGVRVITYFPDEVDRIGTIVRREFDVDWGHSIDKRQQLDPDRFGYLSLHYVVAQSSSRTLLPEYRRFEGYRAGLQLRSVLQHTWAEIEHDLGYKTTRSIPRDLRRRFSCLAGLLELADNEFAAVREALLSYERKVREQLATEPSAIIGIDQASLGVFVTDSPDMAGMYSFIVENRGQVGLEPFSDFLSMLVNGLQLLGITTIGELRVAIASHRSTTLKFMLSIYRRGSFEGVTFYPGAPLLHLCYVLAIEDAGRSGLEEWFAKMRGEPQGMTLDAYVACYQQAALP